MLRYPLEKGPVKVSGRSRPRVRAKRKAEPECEPHHAEQCKTEEDLHENRYCVFLSQKARLKHSKGRNHQQDQAGGNHYPCGVSSVYWQDGIYFSFTRLSRFC